MGLKNNGFGSSIFGFNERNAVAGGIHRGRNEVINSDLAAAATTAAAAASVTSRINSAAAALLRHLLH